MTFHQPRHPIVIIGAGIAGLSAAMTLQDMDVPCIVLERFNKPGGRLQSRAGDGWLVDHGTQYIRRSDALMVDLIRKAGYEKHRVTIQGAVHQLVGNDRVVVPPGGGYSTDRLCLDNGFASLTHALADQLTVVYDTGVGAIRWDNDEKVFPWQKEGQVFWFEDIEGEPIRNPVTREVLVASGVILATTPTAALKIADKSPSLSALEPILSAVKTSPCFTGIYRIPRTESPFYALEGDDKSLISWMAFEDRKAPERTRPDYSVMIVQASPAFSSELMPQTDVHALTSLYAAARRVIYELPELPNTQTCKKWNVAFVKSPPLGYPAAGIWPTNPTHAPFALAGDYLIGSRAEDAAQSGQNAARQIVNQLPARRTFLGIELQG